MLDQWFLFLLFICATGFIAFGGFLIACGFEWLVNGKQAAREFFFSEW